MPSPLRAGSSRQDVIRRVAGYTLVVGGAITIVACLPLWFWLTVLGAAAVAAGWFMVGAGK